MLINNCTNISGYKSTNTSVPKNRMLYHAKPMMCDTVSFTSMKKSEFKGYDAYVVEKYKAPIQKFSDNNDLQIWASGKCKDIIEKNYGGRRQETQIQREAMLKEWGDYVINESGFYRPTQQLIILDSITKDLKPNEDRLPPVLNKGVLADTVEEIGKTLKEDSKTQINFIKKYDTKLKALYLEDTNTGEKGTKWVIIPSKKHDTENFDKNVEKLKMLSHKNWCTKSGAAQPYLSKGDFHVYLVDGQPKLGIRYAGDKIAEIQGEKNNTHIPPMYYEEATKHIEECRSKKTKFLQKLGFSTNDLSAKAKGEIDRDKLTYKKFNDAKNALADSIKNNDYETIFNYFGMEPKKDKDGLFTISHFNRQEDCDGYTYSDLGINESKMLEKVKEIRGDIDLSNTNITKLVNCKEIGGNLTGGKNLSDIGKLKRIGGNADLSESKVSDLKELEYVGGYLDLDGNKDITSLKNIREVGGDLKLGAYIVKNYDFIHRIVPQIEGNKSPYLIEDLGKLKKVGGILQIGDCNIKDLGELEEIGDDLLIEQASNLKSLSKLKTIQGSFYGGENLESLGELEYIGGNASFRRCKKLKDTGKVKEIGFWADFTNSSIERLPELRRIGTSADFDYSRIEDLNKLEEIGSSANFSNSMVRKLGALKLIGGHVNFSYSHIKDLENLEHIEGDAIFSNSPVENLGKLVSIDGDAFFGHSKLKSLFNLKYIDEKADFKNSKIEDLSNIEYIYSSHIDDNAKFDINKLKEVSRFINDEWNGEKNYPYH